MASPAVLRPVTPASAPSSEVSTPASDASPATSVTDAEEQAIYRIDDLVRARAEGDKADEPIVAYPVKGTEYAYYTPRELHNLVEAASVQYSRVIPQRRTSDDPVQVVGLLGPSDFEYLITLCAISRLGHTVLLLSTRIAEDAYVSLLESTKASFLIAYPAFQNVARNVTERTGSVLQPVLAREDYINTSETLPEAQLDGLREAKNITWIIHSSGSTGHPKPIYQTHSGALRNYANNFGLRGYITLPLYHAHGISCLFRALHSQKLIYIYNAELPLTGPYLLTTLQEHEEIEVLYAVPYGLKLLSESDEAMKVLSRLELVMFGGSSCPKPIGDKLAQHGVRLVSHYGTTETGQLMTSFRERSDLDWDYVRPGPSLLPYVRWEEQMPGIYELCVLEGWPSKVASNRSDGAYATKDLFEQHPTKENAWRYYARLDDTLVLENGEKANPLVIEGVARNHPNVAEAIAFGANRPRLGLFLIRTEKSTETDEQVVDSVFPAIEKNNAESPAYAYISRDMIRVLPADTVYRKTDKGTVIRSAFYRDFAEQINQVYDQEDASGSQVLEGTELITFLRDNLFDITSIEPSALQDSTDVFSLGVDSLQSLRLRSVILKTLDLGGRKLSQNFVFESPTIQAMADELTRLRLGGSPQQQALVEDRMADLIEKYSRDFKTHVPVSRDDDGEYVVVTGATGSLGAHVVAQLVQAARVRKVFCLVRADSALSAFHRVRQSLHARFLSSSLTPEAERKIVALPADLSNDRLGLSEDVYEELVTSITAVMHCAWSVNFNWALESFEKSCIAGTRNLLDLCLDTRGPLPAKFSFCSSVSTVARTPGNWVPEALPESLSYAQTMGYAQSKLVTEHIVNRASHETNLAARVLRVGQIIADTEHGIWNATEAIPMIFQTAETINALPLLEDVLSWTPVNTIASSVIEATLSPAAAEVMNVTNPTLNHWTQDLIPLLKQAGLTFDALPKREWLARLRTSNPDPTLNPPIKLLEFFASKYDNDAPTRVLLYDTKKTQAAAPSLRNAGGLTLASVNRFVQYFRRQAWSRPSTSDNNTQKNVFILTGPCGSGKSTAAQALKSKFNVSTIEGDDLHSRTSRAKMASGVPLSDADRWEWLAHIRGAVMDRLLQPSDAHLVGVVVTCSALKRTYRDELRKLAYLLEDPVNVTFIHLSVGEESKSELKERLVLRSKEEGHYMASAMVDSQLEVLERPGKEERDVVVVEAVGGKTAVLGEVEGIVGRVLL
ncbi:hypothetical protein BJY04DRAFT_231032 [Aspergillus karnatakaensis]|uniref:uncharacterized protein n=1 Tax=Aspergillus karnatakaensis TaxID=1810916 RepID=UPI003CCCFCFE